MSDTIELDGVELAAGDTVTFDFTAGDVGTDGAKTADVLRVEERGGDNAAVLGKGGEEAMYLREAVISGGDNDPVAVVAPTGKQLGTANNVEVA